MATEATVHVTVTTAVTLYLEEGETLTENTINAAIDTAQRHVDNGELGHLGFYVQFREIDRTQPITLYDTGALTETEIAVSDLPAAL